MRKGRETEETDQIMQKVCGMKKQKIKKRKIGVEEMLLCTKILTVVSFNLLSLASPFPPPQMPRRCCLTCGPGLDLTEYSCRATSFSNESKDIPESEEDDEEDKGVDEGAVRFCFFNGWT